MGLLLDLLLAEVGNQRCGDRVLGELEDLDAREVVVPDREGHELAGCCVFGDGGSDLFGTLLDVASAGLILKPQGDALAAFAINPALVTDEAVITKDGEAQFVAFADLAGVEVVTAGRRLGETGLFELLGKEWFTTPKVSGCWESSMASIGPSDSHSLLK